MSQIDETVAKRAHKVSDGRTDGTSRCVIDFLQMQTKSLFKIIAGSKTSSEDVGKYRVGTELKNES